MFCNYSIVISFGGIVRQSLILKPKKLEKPFHFSHVFFYINFSKVRVVLKCILSTTASKFFVWNRRQVSVSSSIREPNRQTTVCPGSSDPIYIVTYCIKWVTTSWTYCISQINHNFCPFTDMNDVSIQTLFYNQSMCKIYKQFNVLTYICNIYI